VFDNLPRPVSWAAGLTVFNAAAGFLFTVLWPDLDDRATVIVVGGVLALIMLAATYLFWRAVRWGGQAFIAVNVLNVLLALPAPFQGEVAFAVGGVVSALLSIAAIVLALRPEARAHWRQQAGALARAG